MHRINMPKSDRRLGMLSLYLAVFLSFIILNSMPGNGHPPIIYRGDRYSASARALRVGIVSIVGHANQVVNPFRTNALSVLHAQTVSVVGHANGAKQKESITPWCHRSRCSRPSARFYDTKPKVL